MAKIVPVVEGYGEVDAVPVLCYKLLHGIGRYDIQIDTPLNAHGCGNLTVEGGLERFVDRAWNRRDCKAVLILMDADKRHPAELAHSFSQRILAMNATPPCCAVTVLAKTEYEAWFLASLPSIVGSDVGEHFSLPANITYVGDVEARPGVKEWITSQIAYDGGKRRVAYDERRDQLPMTRLINPVLARDKSRSFRRLCHAIEQIIEAIDNNTVVVTP